MGKHTGLLVCSRNVHHGSRRYPCRFILPYHQSGLQ